MSVQPKRQKKKKAKASDVEVNPVKVPLGWNTTDEEEIKRRLVRAETELMKVTNLEPEIPYFGRYTVQSKAAQPYGVEIRSLTDRINTCSCTDYDVNGLGTCKHIEKVLLTLKKKGKRLFEKACRTGSPRAEIYVDPVDYQIKLAWPSCKETLDEDPFLREHFLGGFFSTKGMLLADAKTTIPVLIRLLNKAPESVRKGVRVSSRLQTCLSEGHDFSEKMAAKDFFLQDVLEEKRTLDITKLPLYDYQKQGMMHLAFLEKAILADEMGLGKTVQAIGAAELLRRLKGVRKVLVVAPTSLKAEWEEQIEKFTSHSSLIVYGNRAERLRAYQQDAFFYLTNYEQVVKDREDIQRLMAPDIVILDEAQRIKNWRTKTATTIKQLQSPYAFVLTGTPLENRIDDIYSLVQFLYPKLFGSLFRFNREFYQLDDKGKPIGYKNLHLLHERLKPILLRRLKADVEDQLPPRTINTYFVPMSPEQLSRYEEQEDRVARLAKIGRKRPLQEEEFKRLQMALASMRMICDTPYILDEACRICPKLHELEAILEELFQEDQTKVIIFSEWERMLQLVGELLKKMAIDHAWHTGSIDQVQRRKEIHRFKEESLCKVFLSTDCGSVGLNLQVANVVINLDLPWNPAKLEQRIARAWRKHQTRHVQVINLVSEETLEHRMLGVLDLKKRLADTILDLGTVQEMDMPSGRKAFMEQLDKILGSSERRGNHWDNNPLDRDCVDKDNDDKSHVDKSHAGKNNPDAEEKEGKEESAGESEEERAEERGEKGEEEKSEEKGKKQAVEPDPLSLFQQEVIARFKPRLHHLEAYEDKKGHKTIFAVVEGELTLPAQKMQTLLKDLDPQNSLHLEVLDRGSFETLQRLCKAGVLSFNQEKVHSLYQSQGAVSSPYDEQKKRRETAQGYMGFIERKERMASLLMEGHFYEEALPVLRDIFSLCLKSFAALTGPEGDDKKEVSIETLQKDLILKKGLTGEAVQVALDLHYGTGNPPTIPGDWDQEKVLEIFKKVQSIHQFVSHAIHQSTLECAA